MEMESHLEVMKRYFTNETWAKGRQHYEQWPSEHWRDLYRDVEAALGDDPSGDKAQALAARWVALVERDAGGDPVIRAGMWKAWVDRRNWPEELRQRLIAFKVEQLTRFIHEAIWEFSERQRQRMSQPRPPDRVHPARISLFHRIKASLDEDPSGNRARSLVAEWNAMLDREAGGDAKTKAETKEAWASRANWPAGFRQYVASLYNTDWDTWEQVTRRIEQINEANPPA
jgi:hypothetical protein